MARLTGVLKDGNQQIWVECPRIRVYNVGGGEAKGYFAVNLHLFVCLM